MMSQLLKSVNGGFGNKLGDLDGGLFIRGEFKVGFFYPA